MGLSQHAASESLELSPEDSILGVQLNPAIHAVSPFNISFIFGNMWHIYS